jgi:sodium-dependent dicarboxylate transporter 2/3/5
VSHEPPSRGRRAVPDPGDHADERAATLLTFALQLVEGGAKMLGPVLRGLPGPAEPTAPMDLGSQAERLMFKPLRVLTPRVKRSLGQQLGRFAVVLALTVAVLLVPTPEGMTWDAQRGLAAFVFTGSILALEPVSLPIAALLVPVALVALNIANIGEALEPFASPTVFLVLSSLFLAEALRKHGLTRRLALMTTAWSGGEVGRLLFGLMAVAAFFSMWVENTATAAILVPVALTIASQVRDPDRARPFLVLLVLGIAYAASIGGMATIMGSSSNAVASDFMSQIGKWTFFDWMKYGFPSMLILFPITWWLLRRMIPVDIDQIDVGPARRELEKLGSLGSVEKQIVLTMAVAIFFWVTGGWIEEALGLPPSLMSATVVAIVAVGYLSARGVIEWDDVKGVSWGIFFVLGAGLALGEALVRTGATEWFAELVDPVVSWPLLISIMALVYMSALMTNILNNTTIAAVFVPILIAVAANDPDLDAVTLVMPVTLATTFGYSLPSASGRMALIAATGVVTRSEMMRYGLNATIVSAAVLGMLFFVLTMIGLI